MLDENVTNLLNCLKYLGYLEYGLIEFCTGPLGSNEVLFTYDTEVAAYMDLEEGKLNILVPDIAYSIPGFDLFSLNNFKSNDIGLTPFCKDASYKMLSINASEPIGKISFFVLHTVII